MGALKQREIDRRESWENEYPDIPDWWLAPPTQAQLDALVDESEVVEPTDAELLKEAGHDAR